MMRAKLIFYFIFRADLEQSFNLITTATTNSHENQNIKHDTSITLCYLPSLSFSQFLFQFQFYSFDRISNTTTTMKTRRKSQRAKKRNYYYFLLLLLACMLHLVLERYKKYYRERWQASERASKRNAVVPPHNTYKNINKKQTNSELNAKLT